MAEAQKEKAAERQDDFKSGIKHKTEKRAQQNTDLRKKKRDQKLKQRRAPVQAENGNNFDQMLSKYNKAALLGGDMGQLRLLNQLLGNATKHQLEKHIDDLLFISANPQGGAGGAEGAPKVPAIVHKLLGACKTNAITDAMRLSLMCLLNLTGTKTSFEVKCAELLIQSGFLDIVKTHLDLFTSGKHPSLDSKTHGVLWECVVNLIITCPEARNVVLLSPLMGFKGDMNDAPIDSAFTRDLKVVFGPQFPPADKEYFIPLLLAVICSIYESNETELPPLSFTLTAWNHVVQAMYEMQLMPWQDMSELQQLRFNSITSTLFLILNGLKKVHQEDSVRLIAYAGQTLFMQTLSNMFQFASLGNQIRIVKIFVQISALPLKEGEFQFAMRKANCVRLMMLVVQSNHPELRQHGFFWIGNYTADGVQFVHELIEAGIIDALIPSIRRDVADIRRSAVYALMTMFSACDEERKNNMQTSDIANGIMHALVTKHRIFTWIAPFISMAGEEIVVIDILDVMARALQWNKKVTLEAIEHADALGRIDVILAEVTKLKGSQFTAVYNAAVHVDNLVNNRPPEQDRTELMETEFDGGFLPGTTIQQGSWF